MSNYFLIASVIALHGCAAVHYPELPGPPRKVDCQVQRENSMTGTYRCEFEGEYVIQEFDIR